MAEYIEREAVLMLCQDFIDSHEDGSWRWVNAVTDKDIMNIPSADVVGVVRCKDCKHYDKEYHQCKLHSEEPDQYYTGFIFCMQEDDFCSYGERKELDNDT